MNKNGYGPYTPTPSKALSNEISILLSEVGKLRDERRALQYEIAELMQLKSKHGAGGEFEPDWRPQMALLEQPPPPPPAIEAPPPPAPAPAGWRVVHKRPERKPRMIKSAPPPAPAPAPPPEPPKPDIPAWAQWRPNPLLAPAATPAPRMTPTPPSRRGLFGPATPPPK
ncbi:hypothetical protein H0H93_004009 [Arthromyces matolae]|nr:hypothetical protein H0H93_004009 [Arthromyces matolae]